MPDIYSAHKKKAKGHEVVHNAVHKVFPKLKSQANSNPLASFAVCPPGTRFATQEEGENIILLLRQHPIVNFGWIVLALLLALAPMALDYIPLINFLPLNFQWLTVFLWYFMVGVFVIGNFLYWYFNVYIITDERVVDIDFFGLNYRDVTVIKLDRIQDLNFTQGGLWDSFFNYGHVYVQTAAEGAHSRLDFLKVPNPAKVVEILGSLIDEEAAEEFEGRVK